MSAPTVRPPPGKFAITSTSQQLPSKAIFYGVPGIGKTPVAAQAPRPVFIMTHGENGLETLQDNGIIAPTDHFPEARDWLSLLGMLDHLLIYPTGHATLCLDTLNGAQALCFDHVTKTVFGGSREKFDAYGKGPAIAEPEWSKLVHLMHKLNAERRMAIIAIAHCRVKSFKNPTGDDYDRYSADMHDRMWSVAEKWSDLCLFMNYETFAKKEQGQLKAKAVNAFATGDRFFYTQRTAAFDAKNRFNLPPEIPMGKSPEEAWSNLFGAINQARKIHGAPANGSQLSDQDRVLAAAVIETLEPSTITETAQS